MLENIYLCNLPHLHRHKDCPVCITYLLKLMQAAPLLSMLLSARSSEMSLWFRRCVRLAHAEH